MRRVLTMVVGGPELPTPLPRVSARGEATNISWPSTKNKRFSGKKVSVALRFMSTSSDSTLPKSGFSVAFN